MNHKKTYLLSKGLKQLGTYQAPSGVWTKIEGQLVNEQPHSIRRMNWKRWGIAAAIALLVLGIGAWFAWKPQHADVSSQQVLVKQELLKLGLDESAINRALFERYFGQYAADTSFLDLAADRAALTQLTRKRELLMASIRQQGQQTELMVQLVAVQQQLMEIEQALDSIQ